MNNTGSPPTKRMRLSGEELTRISKDEIIELYVKQQELLDEQGRKRNVEVKESNGDKSKLIETSRRENVLVMRLATKEQELQQYAAQIAHIKKSQEDAAAKSLREAFLDPAVNLLFNKMKSELKETKDKLEQAQSELSAWKFTPDSQTGKKLMSRCRTLIAENQELGRQLSQGRVAQLEAELALQKKYSEDLKESQEELNEFVIQLDEEVEGMQSTIQMLQQQLADARKELDKCRNMADDADHEKKPRTSGDTSKMDLAVKAEGQVPSEQKEDLAREVKQNLAEMEVGENGIIHGADTPNSAQSPDERNFENSEFVCKEECESEGENSGIENDGDPEMEVDGDDLNRVEGGDWEGTPVYSEHEIIDESQGSTPEHSPDRDVIECEGETIGTENQEPCNDGSTGRDESPTNEETYAVIDSGSDEETEHVVQIVSTHDEEEAIETVVENDYDKEPKTPVGDFISTLEKQESLDYDETNPEEESVQQQTEEDVAADLQSKQFEVENSEIETRTTDAEEIVPETQTSVPDGERSSAAEVVEQPLAVPVETQSNTPAVENTPAEASHAVQVQPQQNSKDIAPISLNGPLPAGLPPPIAHSMMAPTQVPLIGDPSAYLMNPHFQHMPGAALAQQQVLMAEQTSLMYKAMLAQQQQQQQQHLAMADEKNAQMPDSGSLPKPAEELRTTVTNPLMHGLPYADPQAAFLAQYKAMLAAQSMFVPGPDGKTPMIAPGGLGLYSGLPLVQPAVMAPQPSAEHGPMSIPSSWPSSTTMTYTPNPLMAPSFLGHNPAGMMLYPGHSLTPQPGAAAPAPVEMDKHHGSGDHGPIPNGIPAQKTQEHSDTNPPKEEPQMVA